MATLEDRVSILEAKVDEHSRGSGELRELIRTLDAKVDRRFEAVGSRFDAVDRRSDALSSRIDTLDQKLDRRIDALDQKVDRGFHALDQKISRHFLWLAGFQLTTLLAIIGFLSR